MSASSCPSRSGQETLCQQDADQQPSIDAGERNQQHLRIQQFLPLLSLTWADPRNHRAPLDLNDERKFQSRNSRPCSFSYCTTDK